MRYFVPDIRAETPEEAPGFFRKLFGTKPPSASSGPVSPTERLGGVPFGLPSDKWPTCKECGKSQSLLAQFNHDPERLDLGRAGRVLFVFQCSHDPGMCSNWKAFSGANACFVVEPESLTGAQTALPIDAPPIDPQALIAGWQDKDDGLAPEIAAKCFRDESLSEIDEDILEKITPITRLGSVPAWVQSADEAPRPGWRFVGQLDSTYRFLSPPREQSGPNFGDAGTAFLFLKEDTDPPEGCMFWQCY